MGIRKAIIFDLDGTLLNTSAGIFNSVRYAESKMGLPPIGEELLSLFIGPPPSEMYQKLYRISESASLEATKYHREYAKNQGIYESFVYNGIPNLLDLLKQSDFKLAVATLKSQNLAANILDYHNITKYFEAIVGIDQNESLSKADTIRISLERIGIDNANDSILIGDTIYDAYGSLEVGCKFIGVLYGFGFKSSGEVSIYNNSLGSADSVSNLANIIYKIYPFKSHNSIF